MIEFRLDVESRGDGRAVLRIAGEVDVYTAPQIREQVQDLAAKGTVHLIADLGQVEFIDSSGLGALIGGLRRVREDDGSLVLVIPTRRVLRVFQLTGLTRAFAIYDDLDDALSGE
ncbi:MAG TPA: STAS domain-containing protein [Streptosporangiaceae bacterium]|jgi:anti-sigma B factor antagonist